MANLDFDPHVQPCDVVRAAEGIIRAEERQRLLAEEWAPYRRPHHEDRSWALLVSMGLVGALTCGLAVVTGLVIARLTGVL
jgi:hypothetical protein